MIGPISIDHTFIQHPLLFDFFHILSFLLQQLLLYIFQIFLLFLSKLLITDKLLLDLKSIPINILYFLFPPLFIFDLLINDHTSPMPKMPNIPFDFFIFVF